MQVSKEDRLTELYTQLQICTDMHFDKYVDRVRKAQAIASLSLAIDALEERSWKDSR